MARSNSKNFIVYGVILLAFGVFLLTPIATVIGYISLVAGGILTIVGLINLSSGSGR